MFLFRKPKIRIQKRKSMPSNEVKEALEQFLNQSSPELTKILVRYWKDQQTVFTFKEIREAIVYGDISAQTFGQWQQDYSKLVAEKIAPEWRRSMAAGAANQMKHKKLSIGSFKFDAEQQDVCYWIQNHTAELVTNCTRNQKDAVKAIIEIGIQDNIPTKELARYIRPCIGLTKPQAVSNLKYCNNLRNKLKEDHPKMSAASVEKKVNEAGIKYATKQMRERAETIVLTERANAYEYGRLSHTKRLVEAGLLPAQLKEWSSAKNEAVCSRCQALDGQRVGIDEYFLDEASNPVLCPTLHPRCRCCIKYFDDPDASTLDNLNTEDNGNMDGTLDTQAVSFENENETSEQYISEDLVGDVKKYSEEKIVSMANDMGAVANKHLSNESTWSGKIIIDDNLQKYGLDWNNTIITRTETAPHILLHEQIHAHSISYYGMDTYIDFGKIEEASVQLVAQEISIKESIPIIRSQYDTMVDTLRKINRKVKVFKNDYDFAIQLLSVPVPDRLDWLNSIIYDKLVQEGSIETFTSVMNMLEVFYE